MEQTADTRYETGSVGVALCHGGQSCATARPRNLYDRAVSFLRTRVSFADPDCSRVCHRLRPLRANISAIAAETNAALCVTHRVTRLNLSSFA